MSYFAKTQRFSREKNSTASHHPVDMSPGPATYYHGRTQHSRNNNDIHPPSQSLAGRLPHNSPSTSRSVSRLSKLPTDRILSSCERIGTAASEETRPRPSSRENVRPGSNDLPKDEAGECMQEIYARMMSMIRHNLQEIRTENTVKEVYLKGKAVQHTKKLTDCIDDIANDYVLNGELEVRVLRTPNGKKVGPGTYYDGEEEEETRRRGHNIMGLSYLAKEQKKPRGRSSSRQAKRLQKENRSSFVDACAHTVPASEGQIKSRVEVSVRKLSPGKPSMFQLVRDCNPNNILTDRENGEGKESSKEKKGGSNSLSLSESYEFKLMLKQEERRQALGETRRTLERYRKIVEESHSLLNKTGEVVSSFRADDLIGIDTTAEQTQNENEKDGEVDKPNVVANSEAIVQQ